MAQSTLAGCSLVDHTIASQLSHDSLSCGSLAEQWPVASACGLSAFLTEPCWTPAAFNSAAETLGYSDNCTSEAVDGLSIITDHCNATPLTLQQVDQLRLRTAIQASGLCVRLHELPIPEAMQKLVAAT